MATESRSARPDRADDPHRLIAAGPAEAATPISVSLEALWLTSQLHPRWTTYNEAVSIRMRGPLHLDALRTAFNTLVCRYDTWHSVIGRVEGEPALIPQPPTRFALPVTDLSELDAEAAERQAVRIVADVACVPYDLAHGPLLRPRLLRLSAYEHRLYLAMHHAIFDGVSLARTVLSDLVALYEAGVDGAPLPEEPRATYADFARWERQWMSSERVAPRVDYWRRRLTPAPPRLNLPTDETAPRAAGGRGATLPARVPAATAAALRDTARACGHTEFQALAAVWAALLHRLTGETDIAFATPADLRRRSAFAPVVGYCLSPLVLRVDLGGDPSFAELMTTVRNELLDGLDHLIPFERIVRDQMTAESDGANPIYQTMFVLEPAMSGHDARWSLHQLDPALADAVGAAKVDLELQLDAREDGSFAGQLNYDRTRFSRASVERLIAAWLAMLEALAADPQRRISDIELAGAADRARLAEANATASEQLPGSVAERFAELAARQPLAPALSAQGTTLSYGELYRAARAGATDLVAAGVREGDTVAVCLAPSVGLVVSALAALNAGAGLLLLDPSGSPESLASRASAAGARLIVLDGDGDGDGDGHGGAFAARGIPTHRWRDVGAGVPADGPGPAPDPAAPALLLGHPHRPDAVTVLSRDTVTALASALVGELGLGPGDTVLSLSEMLYLSPGTELWPILLAGGRLVLAPAEVSGDGQQLSRLIRAEGVTFLHATPARWATLLETGLRSARGLRALSGGAPLSRELADRLLERCRVLLNAYTPSAPGLYCTVGRISTEGPVTIGRPLPNHRLHVVDGHGRPVPIGFAGELLLAGPLAGHDPHAGDLVPEPGGTGTARRTGELARWRDDGRLELLSDTSRAADSPDPDPAAD